MKKTKTRLHIRRCHLCSGVTESEGVAVERCQNCGKAMAPFYFFDEFQVAPLSDIGVRDVIVLKPNERVPIRGFTAFW